MMVKEWHDREFLVRRAKLNIEEKLWEIGAKLNIKKQDGIDYLWCVDDFLIYKRLSDVKADYVVVELLQGILDEKIVKKLISDNLDVENDLWWELKCNVEPKDKYRDIFFQLKEVVKKEKKWLEENW